MTAYIAETMEKHKKDLQESVEKRSKHVQEADTLTRRIAQLEGAIFALQGSDFGFILNSWLKSYRNSKFAKGLKNETYYRNQGELIMGLLATAVTVVACADDDEDQILGYIVGQEPVDGPGYQVHYVYIKHLYRRLGFASALTKHLAGDRAIYVTHWRPVCKKLGWRRPL
jgi:ribosomal protein S18 acetylase RimI-like enzyme